MPYASMQVPAVCVIRLTKLVDVKKFVAVKPKRITTSDLADDERHRPEVAGAHVELRALPGASEPGRELLLLERAARRSGPTTSAEVTRRLPRPLWTGPRRPSWARLR